ncbi:hypothetical protein [Deinococcus planocerae]
MRGKRLREKPPSHVCFILVTTEPEKIIPSILVHHQHFYFPCWTL